MYRKRKLEDMSLEKYVRLTLGQTNFIKLSDEVLERKCTGECCFEKYKTYIKCKNVEDNIENDIEDDTIITEDEYEIYQDFLNDQCNNKNCNCDYCLYAFHPHLRFDYDSRDSVEQIENNKKIMKLFDKHFITKKPVIYSRKGYLEVNFVDIYNYNKYDYWNQYNNYPILFTLDNEIKYFGTVNTIKYLIKNYSEIKNFKTHTS